MLSVLNSLWSDWNPNLSRILLILLLSGIVWWVSHRVLGILVKRVRRREREGGWRVSTLISMIRSATGVIVLLLAITLVLAEMGVSLGPILAAAGIAGIAIGFGAQSLIKDVLNGFFVLLENHIRIGDWVEAAGKEGTVEEMTLRIMTLRDFKGNVHIIPFGDVTTVTNWTLLYSRAVVNVGVAYREDPDHIFRVLHEETQALCNDPEWKPMVLDNFDIYGITDFADSAILFKVRVKTREGQQWRIGRELRLRIKRRFDKEGIEIPFPHHTLYWGESRDGKAPPLRLKTVNAGHVDSSTSPFSQREGEQ